MRILMLGTYDPDTYGRGKTLAHGLRQLGHDVTIATGAMPWVLMNTSGNSTAIKADVIIATGHKTFLWCCLIGCRKKTLYDIFIGAHDTLVEDRKLVKKGSMKAKLYALADKMTLRLARHTLTINDAYKRHFHDTYDIPQDTMTSIPVGADETTFPTPTPTLPHEGTIIHFHGTFIPLHGIDTILKAAKIIQDEKREDITFHLIGNGQTMPAMQQLAKKLKLTNTTFHGRLSWPDLIRRIQQADICLGTFDNGLKSSRCITHKVFEYMRMGKCIITQDNAANKTFEHRKHLWKVQPARPDQLADTILTLTDDKKTREQTATGGNLDYRDRWTGKKLARRCTDTIRTAILGQRKNHG